MKKLWISISILLAALIVYIAWFNFPKQQTLRIEAVKYQLGEENNQFVEPVVIHIDGKLTTRITGARTFSGRIEIEDEIIPVPENQRQLQIKFMENGIGHMTYAYFENGSPEIYAYGSVFANRDFSQFTILLFPSEEEAEFLNSRGWHADNGYMISGPATNRSDGLAISNELMSEYLHGYILQ